MISFIVFIIELSSCLEPMQMGYIFNSGGTDFGDTRTGVCDTNEGYSGTPTAITCETTGMWTLASGCGIFHSSIHFETRPFLSIHFFCLHHLCASLLTDMNQTNPNLIFGRVLAQLSLVTNQLRRAMSSLAVAPRKGIQEAFPVRLGITKPLASSRTPCATIEANGLLIAVANWSTAALPLPLQGMTLLKAALERATPA